MSIIELEAPAFGATVTVAAAPLTRREQVVLST